MLNNQIVVTGKIVKNFQFCDEVYTEKFSIAIVAMERLSGTIDYIPIKVSERLVDVDVDHIGKNVYVKGQLRSFNEQGHLKLFVFAKEFEFVQETRDETNNNQIFLDGYICKEPIYRKTPLSREIADLLIVVNRSYGKSDYIPCICWGRNARFASQFNVGERIQLIGRIQSREYMKKFDDGMQETRIAYEVSVSCINKVKESEE